MAELLLKTKDFEAVGVGGSIARGKEEPGDIDLWVFCTARVPEVRWNDPTLEEFLIPSQRFANVLGIQYSIADRHPFLKDIDTILDESHFSWDVHFIAGKPTSEQINSYVSRMVDQTFLQREMNSVLVYDPKTKNFVRKNALDEEAMRQLDEITFDQLKFKSAAVSDTRTTYFGDTLEKSVRERRENKDQPWKALLRKAN